MKKNKLAYILATMLAFSSCKKAINVAPLIEQEMMVSAFVGADGAAFNDGIGNGAGFTFPSSMVNDASGNIFVADRADNDARIRKVTPNGEVTTFAGGIAGYLDGSGTTAQFGNGDNAITIDAANNLYLTDQKNSCIRKITPAGVVSTLVGAPGRSSIDGPIATAGVSFPGLPDITIDATNNIYFTDPSKGVRKISADGIVSTILKVGPSIITGPIATAAIATPLNITTDKTGNIYVSSRGNNDVSIVKISPDGIVSRFAGSNPGYNISSLALASKFFAIRGLSTDQSGNLYVVGVGNHVITKITPDGFLSLVAGVQNTSSAGAFILGAAFEARFISPTDITFGSNGIVYLLESNPVCSIRKISLVDKPTPPNQTEIDKATWNKATTWK